MIRQQYRYYCLILNFQRQQTFDEDGSELFPRPGLDPSGGGWQLVDPDRLKGAENGSTYRDRAGIAGLDWDEREARLTALVESLNEEEKEREERLTKFVNILLNNQQYLNKAQQNLAKRMNDLATQLQSEQELPKQLKVLEQHLKNG